MTFFSNKNNFKLSGLALSALASILTACGGGGGGGGSGSGGPPPRSPHIAVTATAPAKDAVNVNPLLNEITVSFSEAIDPTSLIKEGTALHKLISNKGTTAFPNGSIIQGIFDAANNRVTEAQLALTALQGFKVKGRVVQILQNGATALTTGDVEIAITGYQFVPEEATGLSSLQIFIGSEYEPLVFSGAEILASGFVNDDIMKVEYTSGSAAAVRALGQVIVNGKTLSFKPLTALNWNAKYTVTVKKLVGTKGIRELITDGSGLEVRSMATDEIFSFNTQNLENATITGSTPNGIDANPTSGIKANTNFQPYASSLASTVVLKRVVRSTNVPSANSPSGAALPATYVTVGATVSFDAVNSQIVVRPTSDLRFLQEYEVTVLGGPNGIVGAQGIAANRRMTQDYTWNFTTSEPKILSSRVTSTVPTDSNGVRAAIVVSTNFKVDQRTAQAGIQLAETFNGSTAFIQFDATVNGDDITILPKSNAPFKYGRTYTVTVTPDLKSLPLQGNEVAEEERVVAIASNYTAAFTMDQPKLLSAVPTLDLIGKTSSIIFSYNFDVPTATPNGVVVTQSMPAGFSAVAVDKSIPLSNPRVLEIRPLDRSATGGYIPETVVRVSVPEMNIDGIVVSSTPTQLTKTVAPENTMVITARTPTLNSTIGNLDTQISVTVSNKLKNLTSDQTTTRNSRSAIRVFPSGSNCGSELSGRITYDTNRIYFIPSSNLLAWCAYRVDISSQLVGELNEKFSSSQSLSYTFNTEGLRVQNVFVTYAYETLVDVNESIEIVFNRDLDWLQYSDVVKLRNTTTNQDVSGRVSIWGNKLTFTPTFDLTYSSDYRLTVKSGSFGVEGDLGETLQSDYITTFSTQNFPLSVDNYGPVGTVRRDARYWVEFSRSVGTVGFPQVKAYFNQPGYGRVQQSVFNDNLYTFSFNPNSLPAASTNYEAEFEWIFARGFRDDSNIKWSVRTSASGLSLAKPYTGDRSFVNTLATRPISTIPDGEYQDNCAQIRGCVGKLLAVKESDYRNFTIRGKVKVDLNQSANNRFLAR